MVYQGSQILRCGAGENYLACFDTHFWQGIKHQYPFRILCLKGEVHTIHDIKQALTFRFQHKADVSRCMPMQGNWTDTGCDFCFIF